MMENVSLDAAGGSGVDGALGPVTTVLFTIIIITPITITIHTIITTGLTATLAISGSVENI